MEMDPHLPYLLQHLDQLLDHSVEIHGQNEEHADCQDVALLQEEKVNISGAFNVKHRRIMLMHVTLSIIPLSKFMFHLNGFQTESGCWGVKPWGEGVAVISL